MDACFRSSTTRQWEPVDVEWRGGSTPRIGKQIRTEDGMTVIKEEHLPDGRRKLVLKDPDHRRVRRPRGLTAPRSRDSNRCPIDAG